MYTLMPPSALSLSRRASLRSAYAKSRAQPSSIARPHPDGVRTALLLLHDLFTEGAELAKPDPCRDRGEARR
jgi:hypothetical protein